MVWPISDWDSITDEHVRLRSVSKSTKLRFVLTFSLPWVSLVLLEKFACSNLCRGRLSDDHVDVLAPGCGADGEHTLGQRLGDLVAGDLDDLLLDELVELFADLSHLIF
jgi:hypothetical protein